MSSNSKNQREVQVLRIYFNKLMKLSKMKKKTDTARQYRVSKALAGTLIVRVRKHTKYFK